MPQLVTCPDCGRKLNVPDHLLGRNVKCPGCGQKFRADVGDDRGPSEHSSGVSADYDDDPPRRTYEDRPRPRRRRDEDDDDFPTSERRRESAEPSRSEIRDGWQRVRMGVNLVIIAMWIVVGAAVTALVCSVFLMLFGAFSFATIAGGFPTSSPPTQAQANQAINQAAGTGCALMVGFIMLWGVLILCGLAYAGLRITGVGFCMSVPATRKAEGLKPLALAAFCLAIAGLLFPLMFVGADFAFAQTTIAGCAILMGDVLSGLIGLAEFICFFLFLRGVALAMRKEVLAQNLVMFMIAVPIFFAAAAGALFVLPLVAGALFYSSVTSSPNPNTVVGNAAGTVGALFIGGLVCSVVFIVIGIGLFVWNLMLLYQVRGAIDDWLDRR